MARARSFHGEGSIQTLVILHGAPGDGSLWQPVIEAVRSDVRVIAPTLRWFGPASWDDDGSSFGTDAHTRQLLDIIETDAGAPVAVAAWSYSCHVVLDALLERPDLIAGAFLYEPGLSTYLEDADDLRAFGEDAQKAFGPIVGALQADGPEAAVQALFDSSGGKDCFDNLPADRRDRYLASARIMPLLMGGGQPPALITATDLARIDAPVTVAMGERTRPLFGIASRAVARAIPGARLEVVPDADHMLPEKQPARFASLIDRWLGG